MALITTFMTSPILSYMKIHRSREKDSTDGFAEGMKLFNPKKRDSDKEKD